MIAVPVTSIAGHHTLGASTGIVGRGADWCAHVRAACRLSSHAVELAALDAAELPSLVAFLADRPRLPFRYVSVHAPVKGLMGTDAERAAVLARLPFTVRSIVVHPDLIDDPAPYRALGHRLVVENMDDRKAGGRTADELAPLLAELPDAGFCLDIAHAHTVDPSMAVAGDLLDRYCSRLREVHLSSIRAGAHVELTAEDEARFAPHLSRCRDVPWILEAAPPARWAVPPAPCCARSASRSRLSRTGGDASPSRQRARGAIPLSGRRTSATHPRRSGAALAARQPQSPTATRASASTRRRRSSWTLRLTSATTVTSADGRYQSSLWKP